MFCRTKIIVIGAVVMAASLWTARTYAQSRPGSPGSRGDIAGDGGGIALPLLLRGANLTADQKTQVQQIMATHRTTFQDLFSQLRAAHDQMAERLFSTERLREADLAPHVQRISSLRNQLAEQGLRVILEIRGVLTEEQLARASQRKSQMRSLHSQMQSLWGPEPQRR
jgi:Spy/CpxP family protein refolding chaperone